MRQEEAAKSDRALFAKHQAQLLWFANTRIGRIFFGIKKDGIQLAHVLPNAVAWREGTNTKIEFLPTNHYANRLRYFFFILRVTGLGLLFGATEREALILAPMFVGTVTSTVQPSASAVTGYIAREGAIDESWSTIRAGAGTDAVTNDIIRAKWNGSSTLNNFNALRRGYFMFDTSAIGVGSTISAAVVQLYITTLTTPSDADATKRAVHVAAATNASASSLATTDYSLVGSTSFANIAFASLATSAYNDWTLSAGGISNISKSGISKFSFQSGADIVNSAPTTTGSGDEYTIRAQGHNDANKPKLVITLSSAWTPSFSETLSGTDSVGRNFSLPKTETITLTEALSVVKKFVRSFTETFSLSETLSAGLRWTRRTKPSSSWTERTPPTTTWTDRTPPS